MSLRTRLSEQPQVVGGGLRAHPRGGGRRARRRTVDCEPFGESVGEQVDNTIVELDADGHADVAVVGRRHVAGFEEVAVPHRVDHADDELGASGATAIVGNSRGASADARSRTASSSSTTNERAAWRALTTDMPANSGFVVCACHGSPATKVVRAGLALLRFAASAVSARLCDRRRRDPSGEAPTRTPCGHLKRLGRFLRCALTRQRPPSGRHGLVELASSALERVADGSDPDVECGGDLVV